MLDKTQISDLLSSNASDSDKIAAVKDLLATNTDYFRDIARSVGFDEYLEFSGRIVNSCGIEFIEWIIQEKPEMNHMLLLASCKVNQLETAKYLFKHASSNAAAEIALIGAAQVGNIEFMQWLLDQGLEANGGNKYAGAPLLAACEGGHLKAAQYLCSKGANIFSRDNYDPGLSVLHFAAKSNNVKLIEWLQEQGLNNMNSISTKKGITPLMYACENGNLNVARTLVAKGANINLKDKKGASVLHYAAKSGNVELIEWLLQQGLSSNLKTNSGLTPLQHCFKRMFNKEYFQDVSDAALFLFNFEPDCTLLEGALAIYSNLKKGDSFNPKIACTLIACTLIASPLTQEKPDISVANLVNRTRGSQAGLQSFDKMMSRVLMTRLNDSGHYVLKINESQLYFLFRFVVQLSIELSNRIGHIFLSRYNSMSGAGERRDLLFSAVFFNASNDTEFFATLLSLLIEPNSDIQTIENLIQARPVEMIEVIDELKAIELKICPRDGTSKSLDEIYGLAVASVIGKHRELNARCTTLESENKALKVKLGEASKPATSAKPHGFFSASEGKGDKQPGQGSSLGRVP